MGITAGAYAPAEWLRLFLEAFHNQRRIGTTKTEAVRHHGVQCGFAGRSYHVQASSRFVKVINVDRRCNKAVLHH